MFLWTACTGCTSPAFTCEYLGHNICCRWGTSWKGVENSVLSVKFGFGINIKVTWAASEGFFTLVCLLVVFLKQHINSNVKPDRAFRDLHPNCWFFVWFFVPPFIPSLKVRSMNSFIGSSGVSASASQQLQRRWSQSAWLQQEWRISQPGRYGYLNTHQPPDPCGPGASLQITPKTVTHQTQTQQEGWFPTSLRLPFFTSRWDVWEAESIFSPHAVVPKTANIHQKPSSLTETEWWINKATPLHANVSSALWNSSLMRFERSLQTRN